MTERTSPVPDEGQKAAALVEGYRQLKAEIGRFIVGQEAVVQEVLIAIFAGGHCLLEGVPGLAKTMLVRTIADSLHLSFRRIQFTPDLMPADITGTEIIQEDSETGRRELVFHKGPLFAQMILADEINRTPPKTQAALLEAMQEHRVTIGQDTYSLDEPFFVLATQNPIEQEGTYPLPEAQKDRFLFHILVKYPTLEEEKEILERTTGHEDCEIRPVMSGQEIIAAQQLARRVPVPEHVTDAVLALVRATRPKEPGASDFARQMIEWGAGPRACQHLIMGAKVKALLEGRNHVRLDDVVALAAPALRHRIVLTFNAEAEGVTVDEVVARLLEDVRKSSAAFAV